jgi:hypothetical protein
MELGQDVTWHHPTKAISVIARRLGTRGSWERGNRRFTVMVYRRGMGTDFGVTYPDPARALVRFDQETERTR